MCLILACMSATSSWTILSFSLCSIVNLVTLSDITPEILGNSEMLSELVGEFKMERSVSPYELADPECDSGRLDPGSGGGGGCLRSRDPSGWAGAARLSGGGVKAVLFFPFLVPIILSEYLGHAVSESDEYGNAGQE